MPAHEIGVALAALIFLRWADFEEAEREAIAAFDDVNFEPVLPAKFHWRSWCNIHDPRDLERLFRELPSALDRFSNSRHDAMATQLHRVAPAVEKLTRFPTDTLAKLIYWLSDQPFETPKDRRALRDVLDFVLQNTYDKFAGQFFTPSQVATLMVGLAKPRSGESVYDPCFGSAGLLTAALENVEHRDHLQLGGATYAPGKQSLHLAGVEINHDAYIVGMTRLVLSGVNDPQIELGNSLERVPSNNPNSDGYDIVFANPPWGMKVELYGLDHYPIPTKDSSSLFLQHAISQLRPGGRAVIVVPPSLLFRSGREQDLRRWLAEEHSIEFVVSIPRGAFAPHTSIETCLIMIRRGTPTKSVRFVDGSAIFESQRGRVDGLRTIRPLVEEFFKRIDEPAKDRFNWDVAIEELRELDYDLTPKRRDRSGLELILDSLPKEARVLQLKECCIVSTGRNIRSSDLTEFPPKSNYEPSGQTLFPDIEQAEINPQRAFEFADNPVPYIRIRDVEKGHATRGSLWLMPAAASTIESRWKLRAGDILLSKSGTIGKAGIVRNGAVGAIAANGFFVIRVKEGTIDPHYLLAYLQSTEANAWLEDRARGAAAKHLSVASIGELPIALPPLQIQQRIAEQHRKFGVDALTYLAELLTEDDSGSLASELNDWVSANLKRIENYEGEPASQSVLEVLEEVADSRCPINVCNDCKHPYYLDYSTNYIEPPTDYAKGIETQCLECWMGLEPRADHVDCFEDETPIGPWVIEFRRVTRPLEGISSIPDPTALVGILQRVASNVRDSASLITGNLPNQERARLLTGRIVNLLDQFTRTLVEDATLSVDVTLATEDFFGEIRIQLEIENRGRVPIRDVRFSMHPPMDEVNPTTIPFMQPGLKYQVNFQGHSQRLSDEIVVAKTWTDPAWLLSWSARDLAGESVFDKRELGIDFASSKNQQQDNAAAASKAPLLNSPYVTGNAIGTDRSDVFVGRGDLIDGIRRVIGHSGNVVLLEGNRRAGKSSILRQLEGKDPIPGWLGVYVSFQESEGDSEINAEGIPTIEVFRTVALAAAKTIQRVVGSVITPNGDELGRRDPRVVDLVREGIKIDAPFTHFRGYIELLVEWLKPHDLRLLILLDEFDKLQDGIESGITSPQVPENLRFLLQSNSRLTAVLTSMKRLRRLREEYLNALYGLGTPFDVTSLSKEDAEFLVTNPVHGQLVYAPQAVARAVNLAARQPYLLQCLCESVFCEARASGIRSITVDHVNDAAKVVLKNRHFNDLFRYAGTERRRFILAMCHRESQNPDPLRLPVIREKLSSHGIDVSEEELTTDLEWLTDLELLDFNGVIGGETYSLTVPLMGLWIDTLDYTGLMSKARAESADTNGAIDE